MNRLGFVLLLVLAASIIAIPQTISYQGKLTDLSGIGENDTLDIRFRVFDVETGGDSLWAMTVADVPILHGMFDIDIGPIDLPFDEQYWLEIVVDSEVLAPRVQLTSSPYAFHAAVADSFTGGISPWTQDTMVAHWDSLRNIPLDFADGIDDTGHFEPNTIDTMIAYWDSVRGIPDNLGNRDSIWSKDAAISDTIVMMANAKVHGELIADSIQAVGDNITLDDHIDIYGCANFYAGTTETIYTEGFESGDTPTGWEEEDWYSVPPYIAPGYISYVSTSDNPDGYLPTEGSLMLRYYGYMYGSMLALQQTAGFSTVGYSSIEINLDMLHDTSYPSEWGRIYVNYSLDGSDWQVVDTLHRVDGSTGWKTETIALPTITFNKPAVYIRLVFSMNEEIRNMHIDNLIVTGRGNSPPYELAASIYNGYFIGDGSGLTGTEDNDWAISGSDMYSGITGNVGIGTTSPTELLDVHGTIKAADFQMTSGASDGYILKSDASGNASWADPVSITDGDWERDGNYLRAYNSSDSVIIGGLDPVDVLDVRGSMTIRGDARNAPNGTDYTSDEESIRLTGSTSDYIIALQDGSGRIQHYWNSTTNSPDNLYLVDDEPAWMWDVSVNNNPYMEFKYAPADTAGNEITWTTHMAFDTAGNVGIGLNDPESKFVVKNNTDTVAVMVLMGPDATPEIETKDVAHLMRTSVPGVKNANTAGFAVGAYETGVAGKTRMDIKLSGAPGASNDWGKIPDVEVMTLQAEGNVGIGTTSPAEKLDVNGNGNFTGTVSGADAVDDDEFVTKGQITYEVGDFAQGGIVFWLDETGQHGLLCAKVDQDGGSGIQWWNGSNSNTEAHGDGVYAGEMNTVLIIANQGSNSNDYAAGVCANYSVTESGVTYGDWFLPSKEELNLMYENKSTIDATAGANGGSSFTNATYWSSTEGSNSNAWGQAFGDGSQGNIGKFNAYRVRAVRRF